MRDQGRKSLALKQARAGCASLSELVQYKQAASHRVVAFLRQRAKLLAQLSTELSSADEDGRRTRRVQYAQGRDKRCRPANAPTF